MFEGRESGSIGSYLDPSHYLKGPLILIMVLGVNLLAWKQDASSVEKATDSSATVISNASITAKNVKIKERENGALLKKRFGFGHESGSHPACQVSGNIHGGRNEHITD